MTEKKLNVRLSEHDLTALINCFKQNFPEETSHIWLFGSRVDLSRRGGDIDLMIEAELTVSELVERRRNFIIALEKKIGEQKIDVVLYNPQTQTPATIHHEVWETGVRLI
jgi:transcription antitermination factor NusA-like protein